MSFPIIEIATAGKSLPASLPNLMPFHIDHSGPAPISTFFHAKRVDAKESCGSDIEATNDQGKTHYIATFRGRTVRGLEVPLPEGYCGMVLKADQPREDMATSKKAQKVGSDRKATPRRATRSSLRAINIEVDEDNAESSQIGLDEEALLVQQDDDVQDIRSLKPSSIFSSLVIWNADTPIDEGQDEYLRALTEWTSIAAEISRVDEA